MQHFIHEIFNTLGIIVSVIGWQAIISLLDSLFSLGASVLNLIASKLATKKVYLPPIPVQSRVRRRKHRSSF
ncbi:hypothetical protein [Paenibacillus sp. FSL R5-0914]|uniref:hypothetical protein n=1 Tax=Paenibacillus sp. FSL R5-0914 TaxID=2921665 RepID=UPI0030F6E089